MLLLLVVSWISLTYGKPSLTGCVNGTKACVVNPPDCSPPRCVYFVSYEVDATEVRVELGTTKNWMGAGLNDQQKMVNNLGFTCSRVNTNTFAFWHKGKDHVRPDFVAYDDSRVTGANVTLVEKGLEGGWLYCTFRRPKLSSSFYPSTSEQRYFIAAFGSADNVDASGVPLSHTDRYASPTQQALDSFRGLFAFGTADATTTKEPVTGTTPSTPTKPLTAITRSTKRSGASERPRLAGVMLIGFVSMAIAICLSRSN